MGAIHFSLDERVMELIANNTEIHTFVETGTFRGDTIAAATNHFESCYSVELSESLYEMAVERFQSNPDIHLHHGSSPQFLKNILEELVGKPVLFWLDAHWCHADLTAGADSQSPLLEELHALQPLHPESIVLIDDARLYLATPPSPHRVSDWPGAHEIITSLLELSTAHRLAVFDDVIAFYPESLCREFAVHMYDNGADWLIIANEARQLRVPKPAPRPRTLRQRMCEGLRNTFRKVWANNQRVI